MTDSPCTGTVTWDGQFYIVGIPAVLTRWSIREMGERGTAWEAPPTERRLLPAIASFSRVLGGLHPGTTGRADPQTHLGG